MVLQYYTSMLEGNGNFMPPQFWFALTLLFGSGFVGIIIFIVKRFLDRLDVTIDWLKENVLVSRERLDRHDKDVKDIKTDIDQINDKLGRSTRRKSK